ncbi:phosphotransferase family protein [Oceanobacillus manasiensis]|uniref:phosphotransferase family protein n=1 Tax=Oceanobacillus manasiensis TaxID=586413 RepID=UPI0005A98A0A|nr:aminoglycoside phosphotransferase family protein [Oceanobacillus manasiensis]
MDRNIEKVMKEIKQKGLESLENLLLQLNLGRISNYKRIKGGRDSVVFKVGTLTGEAYAVRILPEDRLEQFRQEEKFITVAMDKGIPVPIVQDVRIVDKHAVMIMEWARGRTVLEELLASPKDASGLGYNFGRMQHRLHSVMPYYNRKSQWLDPQTDKEKELYEIANYSNNEIIKFLHMDFHPLNVLAENNKITAVLDWVNASTGDYRYDLARTYSILNTEEARRHLGLDHVLVRKFREAWLDGYYGGKKERDELVPYLNWANLRLSRELAID